jgi:hypothetical protein
MNDDFTVVSKKVRSNKPADNETAIRTTTTQQRRPAFTVKAKASSATTQQVSRPNNDAAVIELAGTVCAEIERLLLKWQGSIQGKEDFVFDFGFHLSKLCDDKAKLKEFWRDVNKGIHGSFYKDAAGKSAYNIGFYAKAKKQPPFQELRERMAQQGIKLLSFTNSSIVKIIATSFATELEEEDLDLAHGLNKFPEAWLEPALQALAAAKIEYAKKKAEKKAAKQAEDASKEEEEVEEEEAEEEEDEAKEAGEEEDDELF